MTYNKCICTDLMEIPDGVIVQIEQHSPKCIWSELKVKKDKITEAVREDLLSRSEVGIKKYGTTLDENKGNERYWLQHAYEEALDLAQYLKRRIMEIDNAL